MANEASIRVSLQILKIADNGVKQIDYQSRPTDFRMDVTGAKGATPGAITATVGGTDVDLTQLVIPHLTFIKNLDATNYVEVGIYDPTINEFYPFMKILPGQGWIVPLASHFGEAYLGTGTSSVGVLKRLRVKANTAPCNVSVDSFEA